MSLLLIAIFTNSVFVCLSHYPANRAREMQHSVLLFISRGEDISLPLLEFHKFNYGAVFDSVLFPFSSGGLVLQGTVRHEFVSTPSFRIVAVNRNGQQTKPIKMEATSNCNLEAFEEVVRVRVDQMPFTLRELTEDANARSKKDFL